MNICPVCTKSVSEKCNSIQCDICNLWIHQFKCSGLNRKQFEDFCKPNSDSWYCPNCVNTLFPFSNPKHVATSNQQNNSILPNNLSDELKSLLSDLNGVVTGLTASDDDQDEFDIQFHSNSCGYLNCSEFNSIVSKTPTNFSAFHLNTASISKHFDELEALLANLNCNFSFIGISETRSLENGGSAPMEQKHDFPIPEYEKFFTPTESSAGGVSLYVLKSLSYKPRPDLDKLCYLTQSLESIFVEIVMPKSTNIIVGTVYRHPSMSISLFNSEFLKPLLHKISSEKKQILLLGDFNIDLLKCDDRPEIASFMDILGSHLILPQILLPTRVTEHSKTLIDNILSSPTDSGTISGNLCYAISDHLPQFCLFPKLEFSEAREDGPYFRQDWSKFNRDEFILDYLEINWNTLFERFGFDPDLCFNVFNDKIKVLIDRHVPTVKLTKRQVKAKLKPWITPGILKSISKRDTYHRKFIKAKNPETKARFYASFKLYRNLIVTLCRQSKSNHYSRYFDKHSKNTRKVWSGVHDLIASKSKSANHHISISIGDTVTSNPETVSNCFNDFFTTIADSIRAQIPPEHNHYSRFLKNRNPNSMFLSPTTPEEIIKVVSSFSDSKATGPHSIPVSILKLLKHDICEPISILINRSFATGIFPTVLKVSKVVPVFKNKGSPLEISNYRPISLLSNIEKIYEKMMYSRLIGFLNQSKQIYSRQFGFRKGHSTVDTLINIVERIRVTLDKSEFACGVFVDLQKAFDTVDHEILLLKLSHYGIRGTELSWFRSYLSNRSQFVVISNTKSRLKFVKHGVPQGSVLGPLLFLLYINDLHFCIKTSETYHFADDTHLLNFSKTVRSLCGRVNADLRVLVSWLNANKISLNASKTEFVIFRSPWKRLDCLPRLKLAGKILTPSKSVKYLGVHLDEHLNWKIHISTVASKLCRANGALSKLRHFVPTQILLNIYHAIFSSHFRYASQIWGLCDNSVTHRIQTLQNTAIRLITFNGPRVSATPLYAELGILKAFDQVKVMNILHIHKYLNGNLPTDALDTLKFNKINHSFGTRGNSVSLLKHQSVNTTCYGLNSFTRLSSNQWNELQKVSNFDLSELKFSSLKSLSTKFYISKYTE